MARVTHVKKARQRYETVPVLDENGQPKRTPVMKRVYDYETKEYKQVPRTDKRGREVTMRVTVQDKDKPLPNLVCDHCDKEIEVGTPYKHITPRSGPYGGRQRNRHESCPTWQVWEYSYSRAAQVARVQHDMHGAIDSWEPGDESDFDAIKQELQDMAQEAVDEAQEAVDNMPEQLQDGSRAQENAEMLESWVEEFDNLSEPDAPFNAECEVCDGTGQVMEPCDNCMGNGFVNDLEGNEENCVECDGAGEVEDECQECDGGTTDGVNEDWVEEAREALREAVDAVEI